MQLSIQGVFEKKGMKFSKPSTVISQQNVGRMCLRRNTKSEPGAVATSQRIHVKGSGWSGFAQKVENSQMYAKSSNAESVGQCQPRVCFETLGSKNAPGRLFATLKRVAQLCG
jgi:hypothetical protein